jgi:hypothetical protein
MAHTVFLTDAERRNRAHLLIDKAPSGFVVTVKEPKRTTDQNAKMWAMLSEISIANPPGYSKATPEIWKCRFLNALGHECQTDIGLDGRPYVIGMSSSALTKSEFTMLIELILAFGAKHNITFKDPVILEERAA